MVLLQKIFEGKASPIRGFLCGDLKHVCDEFDLPFDVALFYPLNLPLPYHIHYFVSLYCSPCRVERIKPKPWLDKPLYKTMVLFNNVIEILDPPQFAIF